ncbi:MAG: carbohydrate-binding family 9-like protein [Planctomycetota bacterium]|nr:carbohydrate-binding family 9-like protein [Planctomycetota bacterium]
MRLPPSPRFFVLAAFSLLSVFASCSSAPDHPTLDLAGDIPRLYAAKFTHDAPNIDGSLDDQAWRDAPWTANFVAIEGSATSRPRYQSRAKMLWNRQYLFLGVWMIEPNLESIPVSSLGYDGLLTFVTRDAESGTHLQVSLEPGNLLLDSKFVSGTAALVTSPASIQGKVALSGTLNTPGDADRGWWAEIAIPWAKLADPEHATIPSAGETVRVNYFRKGWSWSPYYQHDLRDAELWGKVELKP